MTLSIKDINKNTQQKGMLIVLSGPSGAGKGNIIQRLIKQNKKLVMSVSVTTRDPREKEVEGVDYFFRTEDEFSQMVKNDGFLEYKCVFGRNNYGTPKSFVEQKLIDGYDVILEIDVEGALEVKKNHPELLMMFIMPPSIGVLEKRLRSRGTETEEDIKHRMATAKEEIKSASKYDYFIINDNLNQAVEEVCTVIMASRLQTNRQRDLIDKIIKEI